MVKSVLFMKHFQHLKFTAMKTIINQLLEALRERVTQNLKLLRENELEIRKILAEPLSNQRTHNLNNRSDLSKKILAENADFLNMQNIIITFLNKYKTAPEYKEDLHSLSDFENQVRSKYQDINNQLNKINETIKNSKELNNNSQNESQSTPQKTVTLSDEQIQDSIFRLTVNGEMEFNSSHPYFNDEVFLDDLLNYHSLREEYEICARLVKAKK
jgi:hypothetical protein